MVGGIPFQGSSCSSLFNGVSAMRARIRCAYRMAHSSPWTNLAGYLGAWIGPARRWAIEGFHPGDVVWFPHGEKHWHGATATTAMSHIAIDKF